MKLNAYTIYDVKSLVYSPPFFAVSHGAASRMLGDLVADNTTTVGRHPRDFTLYCIGSFDDAAGLLLQSDVREHIADAAQLVVEPAQPVFNFDPRRGPVPSDPPTHEVKPNGKS